MSLATTLANANASLTVLEQNALYAMNTSQLTAVCLQLLNISENNNLNANGSARVVRAITQSAYYTSHAQIEPVVAVISLMISNDVL